VKLELMQRPLDPDSTWLLDYRRDVTSQCGEDGILQKIFELIGERGKVCVEFGAWDGRLLSNTHALITQRGWSGYLIEANAERFRELQQTYHGNPRVTPIQRFVRLAKGEGTLDEILAEHRCPEEIDLLSIDIDGNDYHVWRSMAKPSARVVVIEFNPTVPNDVLFVQDASFEVNQGCSLAALVELGKEKGYELVCATRYNAIFVRREYFPLFNIRDNSPDALYRPEMDGRIFHGFDGTIHVVGMPGLMWHGVPVGETELQVLPKSQRVYPDAQR